jgi:transcriptional regulator with PAS, ATPase and Fis domain
MDESLLSRIIEHLPFYFLATDPRGNIIYCSNAKLFGATNEEINNLNVCDMHELGWIDRPAATKEAIEKRKTVIKYLETKTGKNMMTYSAPVMDADGKITMAVSFSLEENFFDLFLKEIKEDKQNLQNAMRFLSKTKEQTVFTKTKNAQMQKLYGIAKTAACSDSTVHIYGESGTGKEVLAHFIHLHSHRSDMPLLPVNCAAISPELVEAEFFGHAKYAFTGADPRGKAGIFEMAHHGTLFLDEVGELPLSMQSKLLRAIETGEIRRIGDSAPTQTDVRIITATNRKLIELVKEKSFREDLYYRLNVIPVEIPPLRQRKEDIIPLAEHFLALFNGKYHSRRYFSHAARNFFMNYAWPGNIREMKNLIEQLCIISDTDELRINNNFALGETLGNIHVHKREKGSLKNAMQSFEKEFIKDAIDRNGGNVSAAAREIGIHRSQVYKRNQKK